MFLGLYSGLFETVRETRAPLIFESHDGSESGWSERWGLGWDVL